MIKNKRLLTLIKSTSLLLAFGAGLITADAQTINLQLQSDYTTGNATQAPILSVGDVNNDRLSDLVVLNKSNTTQEGPIAVFLNNGVGGFASPINIPDGTGLSPNVAVIGDFNNDGNPDLALANDGISNGVQIRIGNGTGNFPAGTYLTAERGIFRMVTADFNGDGNLDLAGFGNSNDLRVFNGNGAGGFSAATPYTVASPGDIAVSDLNVDGKPDLVLGGSFTILTLLNNGSGVFTVGPATTGVGQTNRITAADFNRDCIPDLLISGGSGNNTRIALGNGLGGFTGQPALSMPNSPYDLALGDFNRDKKVDIVIRSTSSNPAVPNFTIFPGNGAGGFGTRFELTLPIAGQNTFSQQVATIDANLDGRSDILISRRGGYFLYHGNSALFTRSENDFDGDLRSDLSVFRPSAGDWYVQQTTKGFAGQHWGTSTDRPVAADYDGDGRTDIAVWRENGWGDPNRSYFFIFQSSDNSFRQEQMGRIGDVPTVVGDSDGDGKADVAVYRNGASAGAQSYFFYRPSATPGTDFTAINWGINGDQAVRGDFDGDGRQDAAIFRSSDALWYVMQSSNGQPVYQSWGLATDKLVAADYDGDGHTDFAVFRPTDGFWHILNSASATRTSRPWGNNTDALSPSDYNGDGKADIAVYRPSEQRWYMPQCADFKMNGTKFGQSGDTAVPSTLLP